MLKAFGLFNFCIVGLGILLIGASASAACTKTCPASSSILQSITPPKEGGIPTRYLLKCTNSWEYDLPAVDAVDMANFYYAKQKNLPVCLTVDSTYNYAGQAISITAVEP